MNKVIIVGRLGKDVETRDFNGQTLASFSVATKGYKDATDWHNVQCWGKTAELAAKYLQKGSQVGIVGSIRYSKKDDKYFTNIVCDNLEFLSSKSESTQTNSSDSIPDLDSLPF